MKIIVHRIDDLPPLLHIVGEKTNLTTLQ